jgi:ferredoxin
MTGGPLDATVAAAPSGDDLAPLLRWLDDQPASTTVELVCAEQACADLGDAVTAVVTLAGCAVDLTVATFLELAEVPTLTALTVRTDGCPNAATVAATVREAATLLAAVHTTLRLTVQDAPILHRRRDVYPLRTMPVSRRRLFTLGAAGATGQHDGARDTRSRARAALRRLGAEGDVDIAALRAIPAAAATLDAGRCTACGVCVNACPTGALRLTRTGPAFALVFDASSCTDCGQCTRLCPERTLVRTGRGDWAEVVKGAGRELAHGEARSCSRCGGSFTASALSAGDPTDLCPVCAYRRSSPFGSRAVARG